MPNDPKALVPASVAVLVNANLTHTYTETVNVTDITPAAAQSALAVERARSVEPVKTAMRYLFAMILLLLAAFGAWAVLAKSLGLDSTVIGGGLVAIAGIGAPIAIALNKALSRGATP